MNQVMICEQYSASTFNGWTDGPKYVIDTMALPLLAHSIDDYVYYAVNSIDDVDTLMAMFPPKAVGTIYIVSDDETAARVFALRPDMDIRRLVM